MSNYALTLLVIFYLQQLEVPILYPVETLIQHFQVWKYISSSIYSRDEILGFGSFLRAEVDFDLQEVPVPKIPAHPSLCRIFNYEKFILYRKLAENFVKALQKSTALICTCRNTLG